MVSSSCEDTIQYSSGGGYNGSSNSYGGSGGGGGGYGGGDKMSNLGAGLRKQQWGMSIIGDGTKERNAAKSKRVLICLV